MAQGPIVSMEEVRHDDRSGKNVTSLISQPSVVWKAPVLLL